MPIREGCLDINEQGEKGKGQEVSLNATENCKTVSICNKGYGFLRSLCVVHHL